MLSDKSDISYDFTIVTLLDRKNVRYFAVTIFNISDDNYIIGD